MTFMNAYHVNSVFIKINLKNPSAFKIFKILQNMGHNRGNFEGRIIF